jgi:hypothetical protein
VGCTVSLLGGIYCQSDLNPGLLTRIYTEPARSLRAADSHGLSGDSPRPPLPRRGGCRLAWRPIGWRPSLTSVPGFGCPPRPSEGSPIAATVAPVRLLHNDGQVSGTNVVVQKYFLVQKLPRRVRLRTVESETGENRRNSAGVFLCGRTGATPSLLPSMPFRRLRGRVSHPRRSSFRARERASPSLAAGRPLGTTSGQRGKVAPGGQGGQDCQELRGSLGSVGVGPPNRQHRETPAQRRKPANSGDAGGGTQTPDTRIMIPWSWLTVASPDDCCAPTVPDGSHVRVDRSAWRLRRLMGRVPPARP